MSHPTKKPPVILNLQGLSPLITGEEFANIARVHPETVKRWRKAGLVNGIRCGPRLIRYLREDVVMYLRDYVLSLDRTSK